MKIVAGKNWTLNDVIDYIKKTGNADVEQDLLGNIVIYPKLYEGQDGELCEGNLNEEGEVTE